MAAISAQRVGGQYINIQREQYLVRGLWFVANAEDIGGILITQRDGTPIYVRDVTTFVPPGAAYRRRYQDGKEVVLGMALARTGERPAGRRSGPVPKVATALKTPPENIKLEVAYDRTGTGLAKPSRWPAAPCSKAPCCFYSLVKCARHLLSSSPFHAWLVAFLLMDQTGASANLMSLGGLIIAGHDDRQAGGTRGNAFRRHHAGKPVNSGRPWCQAARGDKPGRLWCRHHHCGVLPLFALTGIEGQVVCRWQSNMTLPWSVR